MSQVRFSTVQDLFDAYPSAREDVGVADTDMRSLDFLRGLIADREWERAISFCCYLLSRRAAVGWTCRSLRRMVSRFNAADDKALHFAEAWFEEPDEARRQKALALGNMHDSRAPATWVALAAGWSGGSVVPAEFGNAPTAPEQTARASRVALFMALSTIDNATKDKTMKACLEDGLALAGDRLVTLR